MPEAFEPPRPPYAKYSALGKLRLSDYLTYFKAMRRNPLEVWGEHHFSIRMAPFRFLGRSNLLLSDPEGIHHCFVTRADNFTMNPLRQAVLKPFLRDGLLTAEGETWKKARKAVSPVFTPRKVNAFAPLIRQVCEDATDRLAARDGQTEPMAQFMVDLTLDVLMETLFSGDEALDKAEFTQGIHVLLELSGVPHPFDLIHLPGWIPRIGQAKARRVIEDLRRQVTRVAVARRARPSPEEEGRAADFLDLLLGAGLDDEAVTDNLLTFLAAGHETTARSLAWTLYLLSRDEETRQQLEAEIDAAPLDETDPADWTRLLPWTEAVLKESLRLYPSAPILARTSKEWDLVCGVPVPGGTDVVVATWLLHRQRDIWDQPNAFRPDRFLGEAAKDIPRDAYLPFGIGPRVCIGARFAMMEMVIVMACLLRKLRFDYAEGRDPLPVLKITLQPDTAVEMRVTERRSLPS